MYSVSFEVPGLREDRGDKLSFPRNPNGECSSTLERFTSCDWAFENDF